MPLRKASPVSNRTKPPLLRIMEGGGQGTRSSRGQLLEVRGTTTVSPGGQLALPGLLPSTHSTVVSTSFASLLKRSIQEVLLSLQIRRIVDIRIAPSFRRFDLPMRAFLKMLDDMGISYRHFPSLANRFRGLSSHPELLRSRYEAHLDDKPDKLRELRSLIDEGPVLLIGVDPSGPNCERDIILRILESIRPGFELQRLPEL
jgi:hypothetical protein